MDGPRPRPAAGAERADPTRAEQKGHYAGPRANVGGPRGPQTALGDGRARRARAAPVARDQSEPREARGEQERGRRSRNRGDLLDLRLDEGGEKRVERVRRVLDVPDEELVGIGADGGPGGGVDKA